MKNEICLDGIWSLYTVPNRDVKKMAALPATGKDLDAAFGAPIDGSVPGNFELDLQRAGRIPDPFYGTNTLDLQKLENLHLWYARTFTYNGTADENTLLRFLGIDTVGEIYLNGEKIQDVANMFLTYDIPVPMLKKGQNELVVHIVPAMMAARRYVVPVGSNAQPYNYESLYLRKAASTFGWDIMPRIVSGGIWKSVYLVQRKEERIDELFIYTLQASPDHAKIMAYYALTVTDDDLSRYSMRVRGKCGDSTFEREREILFTSQRIWIDVPNPKLWWPRNAGDPNLYDVTAELLFDGEPIDQKTLRVGIRTVALSRTSTTDKEGNGDFCFVINGKRVFAMGTNWVPLDAFHSRDIERLQPAMDMAVDIGCNIIRLWGGNVYENPKFFDLCDENGIMVWSDFGMGCGAYPQDQTFLDMMRPEVEFIVKQNRNHPSLVLWAGDNECDCAMAWAGVPRDPNTNVVTRELIPAVLRMHDFTRPYLPSSPYIDEEAYRSGKPLSEDHLWGPRDYFKGNFYKNTVCHFASETGYHGCPSPASLQKYIPADKLWPIFRENGAPHDEWLAHAACMRASMDDPYAYRIRLMANQVHTLFGRDGDNLDEFALMSQISQAEAKKYFIERFRVTRGRRNGIIWWNLLDGWPQISDAVVDYYFTKKLAYHFIKRSQNPVLFAFDEPENGQITLYGVNELTSPKAVSLRVTDLTSGKVVYTGDVTLQPECSAPVVSVPVSAAGQTFFLMEWTGEAEGKNHYCTNLLNADFAAYKKCLEQAGMLELEGF